jgi:hypothetical protein
VFILLVKGILTYEEIALRLKVNVSLPKSICCGNSHVWLQEVYPDRYNKMRSIDRRNLSFKLKGKLYHKVSGMVFNVFNIKDFCRTYPEGVLDNSTVGKVLSGTRKSYKDLVLYKSGDTLP